MYEIWVRDSILHELNSVNSLCPAHFNPQRKYKDVLVFLCSQEDDIDGEHIVAFAEEDDPGKILP